MKLTKEEKNFLIFTIGEAEEKWEEELAEAVRAKEMDKDEIEWIESKILRAFELIRKVKRENED